MQVNFIRQYLVPVFSLSLIIIFYTCQEKKNADGLSDIFSKIDTEALTLSTAYSDLKDATEQIGHRLSATENGKMAEEFTFNLFKKYGYEPKYQEFEMESWVRGTMSLTIGLEEDSMKQMRAVTLGHSPEEAEATGEIIDMGNGLPADYEGREEEVKGKIVLAFVGLLPGDEELKNLHRSEKTDLAEKHGAKGIIIINKAKGNILFTGTASITGVLITIPAVSITFEDGMALKEQVAAANLNAHIKMTNTSQIQTARNVIATLEGSELPEEKIIFCGHLDSWDLSSGVADNGIGAFTIIDIARIFKKLDLEPKRTIEFVMYMGEEQGLFGSKAMVKKLQDENNFGQIKYIFNVDREGNPIGFNHFGRDEATAFFTKVGGIINKIDTTFKNANKNHPELHSDHQPFLQLGVPVLQPVSNLLPIVYDCYHADCDELDVITEPQLLNSVRFIGMMLYALSDAEKLPAQCYQSEDEIKNFFLKTNLKEELMAGGNWRWE